MLLVNDGDDVGFSLAFLYYSAMFCIKKYFYFICVCVRVCMIISTVCIHIVTIGDQLDELCSFSGSLPHVY